jgi:hypothetical protein
MAPTSSPSERREPGVKLQVFLFEVKMKYLAILLILALIGTGAAVYSGNGSSRLLTVGGDRAYDIYEVTVWTGTTGHVEVDIPNVKGLLYAVDYYKGNLTGNATAFINVTEPYNRNLANANMTAANTTDAMTTKPTLAGNVHVRFQGTGAGSKTAKVYLTVER